MQSQTSSVRGTRSIDSSDKCDNLKEIGQRILSDGKDDRGVLKKVTEDLARGYKLEARHVSVVDDIPQTVSISVGYYAKDEKNNIRTQIASVKSSDVRSLKDCTCHGRLKATLLHPRPNKGGYNGPPYTKATANIGNKGYNKDYTIRPKPAQKQSGG